MGADLDESLLKTSPQIASQGLDSIGCNDLQKSWKTTTAASPSAYLNPGMGNY
jgi:hypothetical protein